MPGYVLQLIRCPWILGIACCVLVPAYSIAQLDTMMLLKEIEVTAERINLTDIGKHTDVLDSSALTKIHADDLAGLLAKQTPLYVRSYSKGTLATLGIRGGNASHTQLLWNGIPLRNPMIGLVDLSMIPSAFIDEAAVHYGGHGAAFGSGAVGGLISLNNQSLGARNDVHVHLSAGSWDRRVAELKVNYGFEKWRFSTRWFSLFAENNYRYKLSEGQPERNQVHNRIYNYGLLQEIAWSIDESQQMIARLWYQEADRQIPPTSTQTTSEASQQDQNWRASLQWMKAGQKFSWQVKTAWLDESIDYQDSLILLYTQNQFHTWLAEAESSFHVGKDLSVLGGVYTEADQGSSANYQSDVFRYQHALFSSLRLVRQDWLWTIQMREEVTDGDWSPLLLDLSGEWSGIKKLVCKASVSHNYRTPTLNDLYWRPGGNPELEPENGWTMEAAVEYKVKGKVFNVTSSLTAYTRTIDQWIMWMPPLKDIRNYWSPINIATVHSRGLEARGNMKYLAGEWNFILDLGVDLTWSTFGTPLPDFMIEEGDQLFYVPVENASTEIKIEHHQWSGYYTQHWFGSSTGINDQVEAGTVAGAGLSWSFGKDTTMGMFYLKVDNIWNVPYRLIERRPMPGRSIDVGVRFTFF